MPNSIIAEGRTTNEAIENGLKELNAKKEDVIINIIGNEEKRSFFSILEPTKIKVELTLKETHKPVKKESNITEEELNTAFEKVKKFADEFFSELKINNLKLDSYIEDKKIYIAVTGDNLNSLIGYRGECLNSLQVLFSSVANKDLSHKCTVILDIENDREKRKKALEELAEKIAKTVIRQRKKIELEPMTAYERKIIHTKLQDNSKVRTYSIGEEPHRRIVIELK